MNVLLLPDTQIAARVASRLGDWSEAGLLDPFCIWSAADADKAEVRRIVRGHSERLLLGDALTPADPDSVEFVAFYPLAAGDAPNSNFADACEEFLRRAQTVFDFDPDRPLAGVLAVAAASADQSLPRSLFRAEWANLLVAPEDRAGPGAFNRLEGEGDRFLRHSSHAAATIADLWANERSSELLAKLRSEPAGPQRVRLRVVRCFSRIVELGHVADHVAAFVFAPEDGWPRPGQEFERPSDPGPVIADVADAYLKAHRSTLHRRPFKPIFEDLPPRLSMAEALSTLVEQTLNYLRGLPSELVERAKKSVHEKVANYIEQISGMEIKVQRWHELDGGGGFDDLRETLSEGPLLIEDGDLASVWVELRQTTLGLLDGSELPAEVRPWVRASHGRRMVVCDPARLARDSQLGEGEETRFEPLLERVRAEVDSSLEAARKRAAALADAEDETDAEEEYEPWPKRGLRRLLRGGSRIVATARRIVSLLFLALFAIAAAVAFLTPLAAGVAALAIAGAWFYLAGRLARGVLELPRIPEDDRAARELRNLNRALERAQARGDEKRLERRASELDDWIAILGELLHRPWVREPFDGIEIVATTDEETLPNACAVVVTDADQELLERFGKRVKAKAFGPGWLSSIYRSVEELAMDTYYLDQGGVGERRQPFEGSDEDKESPLWALRESVLRGDGRSRRDNPMTGELLEAIDGAGLDEVAPTVVPASAEHRPFGPTATWISPPAGFAAVAEELEERVLGLRGWRATATVVAPGIALTARSVSRDRLRGAVAADGTRLEVLGVERPATTGLALLRLNDEEVGPSILEAAPFRAEAGVVALEASADGVKSRWGFVTKEGECPSVVYDGGDPGVGAAVFDLEGRLLAVQGTRGSLLPVPPIQRLAELAQRDDAPLPPANGVAPPPSKQQSASAFLAEIANAERHRELLPVYWAQPTEANSIEFSLPPGLDHLSAGERIDRLSDGAAFLRPLRVMAHRVEVTRPVEPSEISAVEET